MYIDSLGELLESRSSVSLSVVLLLPLSADPCDPSHCLHGGTCSNNGDGTYKCNCPEDWWGLDCELGKLISWVRKSACEALRIKIMGHGQNRD